MILLAFDTAMAACSVAVIDTDRELPLAHAFVAMERGHAEALAPMVERAMAEAGVAFKALDRIAVTTGPGTFTGVRIGLALARGFGVALNLPVIGLDTLSTIAANVTEVDAPILVAADARKDEVYTALLDENRNLLRPPAVMPVAQASRHVPAGTIVIGTAADAVIAAAGRSDLQRSRAGDLPVAANFWHLAAGLPLPSSPPAPLYLRSPDAKPQPGLIHRAAPLRIESAASAAILAQIHGECFDTPWDTAAIAKLMAMPGAFALVAMAGEEPVAFILARQAADEAEIITIAVRPFAQRKGIAGKLVAEAARQLQSRGATRLFLEVAAGNAAARALYARAGFIEAGLRRTYYATGEDAIVMRKSLAS